MYRAPFAQLFSTKNVAHKMAQTPENKAIDMQWSMKTTTTTKPTNREPSTPPPVPALLTKKWLCAHFGFMSAAGRSHPKLLYKYVLTDEVVKAIGMEPDQVRRRGFKIFDARASALLKQTLML